MTNFFSTKIGNFTLLFCFIFFFTFFIPLPQQIASANPTCGPGYVSRDGTCWLVDVTTTATSGGMCSNTSHPPKTLIDVVCLVGGFINKMLPIIVGLTLLVFFWGLVKMLRSSGDEKSLKDGKQLMIWGVVALFIMVSFVGILNLLYGDFFGGTIGIPQLPQ